MRATTLQNHFPFLPLKLPEKKNTNYLIPTSEKNSLSFIDLFLSLGLFIELRILLSITHSFISVDNSELVAGKIS